VFTRVSVGCALAVTGLLGSAAASAVVLEFTESFITTTTPESGTPWLRAEFADSDTNTVTLTINALESLGQADVDGIYFNLDPGLDGVLLNVTALNDADVSGNWTVTTTRNASKAGGDGYYDLFFDLPNGETDDRFSALDTLVFEISGAGLSAASFYYFALQGSGDGNPGPFLAAAHVISLGPPPSTGTAWIAAVPLPAAVWLLASSLGMFAVALRRRNAVPGAA
jgi:hypothetical protein